MKSLIAFSMLMCSSRIECMAWPLVSRRAAVGGMASVCLPFVGPFSAQATKSGCTDMDSCREIGIQKDEKDLKDNPVFRLENGVSYKVLKPGVGSPIVLPKDTVDLIFSINSSGRYMYSRGFGYEKVDIGGGQKVPDVGLDSYLVRLGTEKLPVGIEDAVIGMKRGERRRVVLPPEVGFETSNWQPEPRTTREKQTLMAYKRLLNGNGASQPPFQAPTIWDVEVVSIRK